MSYKTSKIRINRFIELNETEIKYNVKTDKKQCASSKDTQDCICFDFLILT